MLEKNKMLKKVNSAMQDLLTLEIRQNKEDKELAT